MSWAIGAPSINPETANIIIYRDGDYAVAVEAQTRQIIARSTNHAKVLLASFRHVAPNGKIVLANEITLDEKVTIPDTINALVLEGLSVSGTYNGNLVGSVINVNADVGIEFTANGDWSKQFIFRNIGFKGVYSTPPYVVRYYDTSRVIFEHVRVYNGDIRVENVNYWTEESKFIDVIIDQGGIKFAKTGTNATASLADTEFIATSINPRDNDVAIQLDGTALYRGFIDVMLWLRGSGVTGIQTINGGHMYRMKGIIRAEITSGNCLFDFSGANNMNDIMVIAGSIDESMIKLDTWANGMRFGGFYQASDFVRTSVSPTIGLNNTYGSASVIGLLPPRPPRNVHIVVSGVGTGETITVKIEAYYASDQLRYIEKSFTADGTVDLTDWEIAYLIPLGNNVTPISLRAYAKSSSTTTGASVTVYVSW